MVHWPGRCGGRGGGLQLGSGGGLLRAEHHLQVADATAAQFLPHDTGQRAAAGLGDVRHPQQGGVQLVAGPQRRQDGDASGHGLLDQIQLAGHQIDAVGNVVILGGEEILPMGGVVGGADGVDDGAGGDVPATAGGDLRLGLAHGGVEGAELAVDVGDTDGVLIHQRQLTYAGAGQDLGGIAAHAAQTEHGHMGALQALQRRLAQHHLGAQKLFVHK